MSKRAKPTISIEARKKGGKASAIARSNTNTAALVWMAERLEGAGGGKSDKAPKNLYNDCAKTFGMTYSAVCQLAHRQKDELQNLRLSIREGLLDQGDSNDDYEPPAQDVAIVTAHQLLSEIQKHLVAAHPGQRKEILKRIFEADRILFKPFQASPGKK